MGAIEINSNLIVSPETTAKDLAWMISLGHPQEEIERAIRIFGKFQAKRVRVAAVDIVLNEQNQEDPNWPRVTTDIQNLN